MNDIRDDLQIIWRKKYEVRWEWEVTVFLVVCIVSWVLYLVIR